LQSLSGHSSGIDSVSFDSSEVLVAAGAASGTIKLWDLEEAKSTRLLAISFNGFKTPMKKDLNSLTNFFQYFHHKFFKLSL